jgi:hypothetical protein
LTGGNHAPTSFDRCLSFAVVGAGAAGGDAIV